MVVPCVDNRHCSPCPPVFAPNFETHLFHLRMHEPGRTSSRPRDKRFSAQSSGGPKAAPNSEKHLSWRPVHLDRACMGWAPAGGVWPGCTRISNGSAGGLCRPSRSGSLRGSLSWLWVDRRRSRHRGRRLPCQLGRKLLPTHVLRDDPVESEGKTKDTRGSPCWTPHLLVIFSGPNKTNLSFVQHKSLYLARLGATRRTSHKKLEVERVLEVHVSSSASWHTSHLRKKWTMALQPLAVPNPRHALGNCGQQGCGCEACHNSLHCHRVVFAVFLLQSRAVVLRADADQFVSVPRDEGSCLQRPNSPPAESGAKESRASCTLQSTGVPPGRLGPLGGASSWPSRPAG